MFMEIFALFCRYNLKKLMYEDKKSKLVVRLHDDDEWNFIVDAVIGAILALYLIIMRCYFVDHKFGILFELS